MKDIQIEELKAKVDAFFAKATDKDIKKALKDAGYKTHTGVDPDKLVLRKPVCTYRFADSYWFNYSMETKYLEKSNYIMCFDCDVFDMNSYDAPYKNAA